MKLLPRRLDHCNLAMLLVVPVLVLCIPINAVSSSHISFQSKFIFEEGTSKSICCSYDKPAKEMWIFHEMKGVSENMNKSSFCYTIKAFTFVDAGNYTCFVHSIPDIVNSIPDIVDKESSVVVVTNDAIPTKAKTFSKFIVISVLCVGTITITGVIMYQTVAVDSLMYQSIGDIGLQNNRASENNFLRDGQLNYVELDFQSMRQYSVPSTRTGQERTEYAEVVL